LQRFQAFEDGIDFLSVPRWWPEGIAQVFEREDRGVSVVVPGQKLWEKWCSEAGVDKAVLRPQKRREMLRS
jgi:hypothetical protein